MNLRGLLLGVLVLVAVGVGAAYWMAPGVFDLGEEQTATIPDTRTTTTPPPTTTQTTAPPTTNGTTTANRTIEEGNAVGSYGLLPAWEARYDGSCASCHMDGATLHTEPFHPTDRSTGEQTTWMFLDADTQAAPNVALSNFQPTNISIEGRTLRCSDCHTVGNPAGFGDPAASEPTRDPHAVHRGVIQEEGCLRCHDASSRTEAGWVTDPIDMRASPGGPLLSTEAEAGLPGPDGGENGTGWAQYSSADSVGVRPNSCGDCHGRYHSNGDIAFTFDRDTRVGPAAEIPSGAAGIDIGGTALGCKACHASGVHTVHTNGKMSSTFSLTVRAGAKGAESCLVCHGVGVATAYRGHFNPDTAERLGLLGEVDVDPDATGYNLTDGDCGFCHLPKP